MWLRPVRANLAAAVRHLSTADKAIKSGGDGGGSGGGRDSLGKRLFKLVYPKRSAVVAIRKWKEEGHMLQKYQLNRIVRELRKMKRYKHALEVCEWMTQQKEIKLLPGDYAVHLDLIGKIRGLASAEKFFEDLPDKMRVEETCTALLHTYAENRLLGKAEALVEKMSECGFLRSPLPYNHMLTLYIAKGQFKKVEGVFQELRKKTSPDVVTFNLLLTACASQNDIETAEKTFMILKKAKVEPDWVTYSILSNLYVKNKLHEKAVSTLKEMEKGASRKNRLAYSSLLSLHANLGDKDGLHRNWQKMKSCFRKMNDAEYTCMIASLVKLEEIEEAENLYTEWESVSGTGDPRVSNILLAAYINTDKMQEAEKFYNHIVQKRIKPSYTTWELLTWAYLKTKQTEKVLHYFQKAVGSVKKWDPDKRIIGEVFKLLEENENIEGAEQFLVILRSAGHVSTEIYNSLLRVYAKASRMALVVAERMKKDNVELDEETHNLIQTTKNMRVSEIPRVLA
uniref:Pentatricopeptide repeat-containing protein n=1 Tax=Rhizophora mucronata TaxID=61149 RepID=A0A2P2KPH9_RHIMU